MGPTNYQELPRNKCELQVKENLREHILPLDDFTD